MGDFEVAMGGGVWVATRAARTDDELTTAYKAMLTLPTFAEGARYAVSSETNVKERLDAAVAAFAPV